MMDELWTPDCYYDIPVAYAVFSVIFAEDGQTVRDATYVFVNHKYCELSGKRREELLGKTYFTAFVKPDPRWMQYCTQALQEGRALRDSIYSQEIEHWLDFTVMPMQQQGYVSYTFLNVDADWAQRIDMQRHGIMSDTILKISKILNNEENYETSMNHALRELGSVIRPDRLYILETDRKTISNTFEWCAEGITPEIDTLQEHDYQEYVGGWEEFLKTSSCVLIEDIEVLKDDDPIDYYNLKRQGIKRLLDVPFYHDGELIGYLGADNYEVNDLINTRGILETISYFIGAKITNHNLLRKLERLSRYDDLTGLHNRNAMIEKVGWMKKSAGPVGLIYADLNGLKEINDSLGHQAGDEALRQVAELLIQRYGIENSYRMGGDEFMVLLPMIAECDFRSSVRHLREIVIKDKNISLAIGSEWIDDAAQLDEAIRISDHRMYCDKVEYYNRCGKCENDRQGVRNKEIFAPSGQVSLA